MLLQKFYLAENQLQNWPKIKRLWNIFLYLFYFKSKQPKQLTAEASQSSQMKPSDLVNLWAGTFRNDDKYKDKPLAITLHGQSTIQNNVPIIFGIKPGVVKPLPIKRRPVRRYETRTSQPVTPEQWSYLEVPLRHVQAVRRQIQDLGYNIPVIPMEFVELYMSERPLAELTAPHPGWDKTDHTQITLNK